MKRILGILIAALLITAVSCEKEDPVMDLSIGNINVLAEGGSQTVTFECNYDWTAQASDSWMTLSKSSGQKGSNSVSITIAANTGTSARKGTVTFTCGTLTRSVNVQQAQPLSQSLSFVFTGNSVSLPAIAGNGLTGEVDWGDGSAKEMYSSSLKHTYSSSGSHTVTIKMAGGTSFTIRDATGITSLDVSGF